MVVMVVHQLLILVLQVVEMLRLRLLLLLVVLVKGVDHSAARAGGGILHECRGDVLGIVVGGGGH